MKYFVGLTPENKIYCWSTVKTLDLMQEVETDFDLSVNTENYIVENGVVKYLFPIPGSPIIEYDVQSICHADNEITRKAYWTGRIEANEDYFRIFTPVLHFKNGERVTKYDTEVQTQVDRFTTIENPFNVGEMVNEYEFFVMITKNSVLITDAILMGMQKADLQGVFNTRINYAV